MALLLICFLVRFLIQFIIRIGIYLVAKVYNFCIKNNENETFGIHTPTEHGTGWFRLCTEQFSRQWTQTKIMFNKYVLLHWGQPNVTNYVGRLCIIHVFNKDILALICFRYMCIKGSVWRLFLTTWNDYFWLSLYCWLYKDLSIKSAMGR